MTIKETTGQVRSGDGTFYTVKTDDGQTLHLLSWQVRSARLFDRVKLAQREVSGERLWVVTEVLT